MSVMRSHLLAVAVVVSLLVLAGGSTGAAAQGVHIGGGAVHLDIGNPHGYDLHGYGLRDCDVGRPARYGYVDRYYHRSPHTTFYGSGWGASPARWHDTTHVDYHPGEYVPHRGHYHYIPGHYDVHRAGHWDHRGW